jgi:hypothetical protein
VTANFFPLLGVAPAYGRQFTTEEEVVNGPHVVMLSDRLWRRRYGADPSLVGKTIQVDGVAHEVVGVLPRDFRLQLPKEAFQVRDADMWTPIQFDYGQPLPRNLTFFTVFGLWFHRYLEVYPSLYYRSADAPLGLWELGVTLGFLGIWGFCYMSFMDAFPRMRLTLMTSPHRDEVQIPVNPETMEPLPAHE